MAKRYEQKKKAAQIVRQQKQREERRRQLMLGGSIVAVILLLGGVVAGGIWLSQRGQYDIVQPKAAHTDNGAIVLGDGPVTVDLYEDFMCPACKSFEQSYAADIDALVENGSITVNYHPLAFLNRFSQGTDYSSRSAAAAVCAADEDMFREYTAALFAYQPAEGTTGLTNKRLIEIGEEVGVGGNFEKCAEEQTYRGWVEEGTTIASGEDSITQTPTALVNGTKVENNGTLMDVINTALEKAGITPEEEPSPEPSDDEGTKEDDNASEDSSTTD